MADEYPIFEVREDAAVSSETLGSKPKFWFVHPAFGPSLFKTVPPERVQSGEDWSEKVAAELCELLGLPHAKYELAIWRDQPGIISPNFVPKEGVLELGNEILVREVPDYPKSGHRYYRVSQHTLEIVLEMVGKSDVKVPLDWTPLHNDIAKPVSVFVGYLLLDTLIGNTDRHHENWGYVRPPKSADRHLAPTFDHASCLGSHETDENRTLRLATKDRGQTVEAYVERARSALYLLATDKKPLLNLDAFRISAKRCPAAAGCWLERLASIQEDQMRDILDHIPSKRISAPARSFARKMLECNRVRLLDLRGDLS